jgi:ATP-binding cassette subfamily F protein uup
LSGGERNRLLLARLFSVPSNVLVLDEPTNDLDMETLALLEERLLTYTGTILLVSHDRAFLNNVVTSTIVLEGGGRLAEYVGGYDDWLRQRPEPAGSADSKAAKKAEKTEKAEKADRPAREKPAQPGRKLSYKQTKQLETLPGTIEALETEQTELIAALSSPEFYAANDASGVAAANARLDALQRELDEAYLVWEELDGLTS